MNGIRIAEIALGLPLDLSVTINVTKTTCSPELVSAAFGVLRTNYFGKWITRPPQSEPQQPASPTFVWAIENPGGHLNIHWLVHVPRLRQPAFCRRLRLWTEKIFGEVLCESVLKVTPAYNPRGAGFYMLKGINPAYAAFYRITASDQGEVIGKRSGTSENIGRAAKLRLREAGEYPPAARWPQAWPTGRPSASAVSPQPGAPS